MTIATLMLHIAYCYFDNLGKTWSTYSYNEAEKSLYFNQLYEW